MTTALSHLPSVQAQTVSPDGEVSVLRGPDMRPFYEAVNNGELEKARAMLDRFQANFPNWEPPQDALRAVETRVEVSEPSSPNIEAARASGDWSKIIATAADQPSEFTCAKISNVWALGEAYLALGQKGNFEKLYASLLPQCVRGSELNASFDRLQRNLSASRLEAFGNDLADNSARTMAASEVVALRFQSLAWGAYHERDDVRARRLADLATRINPGATDESDKIKAYLVLRQGDEAYQAGRYEESLTLFEAAASYPESRSTARVLSGWALYQLGRYQEAAEMFAAELEGSEAASAKEGLGLSVIAGGAETRRWFKQQNFPQDVTASVSTWEVGQAITRDHFLAAYHLSDRSEQGLEDIDKAWLQAGVSYRNRDGERGYGRYRGYSPTLTYGNGHERHRYFIQLEYPQVDIGRANSDFMMGLNPLRTGATTSLGRATEELSGMIPRIGYTYEATWQPYIELGTTSTNAHASAKPVGRLGIIRHLENGGSWLVELIAESKQDSLLSQAGVQDPLTGIDYGRAIETGVNAQALYPINDKWSLVGEARVTDIEGHNIKDNSRFVVAGGVSRSFKVEGFEYVSLGGVVRHEEHDRNLNFYTFGNGGYFSPEKLDSVTGVLSFQTEERKQFVVRGVATLGYENVDEGDGTLFPLGLADAYARLARAGISGPFADISAVDLIQSSKSGVAGSFAVEGVYRLNPQWALVGYAGASKAEKYTEYVSGISLRFNFGKRTSSVSRDIFPARLGFGQR